MRLTNSVLAFASRWFDEATVRGTFEPLIADWQHEWQHAPSSTIARARIIAGGSAAQQLSRRSGRRSIPGGLPQRDPYAQSARIRTGQKNRRTMNSSVLGFFC